MDAAVSIHAVERFLGDMAKAEGWDYPACAPPSGKRVLVVGAGPSGLSAAYHLTRLGHAVEIHEAGPVAGGMLQFGIPAYRLPRAELAAEVARIERMGVKIVLNHPVTDVLAERDAGRFDAVFVAIGAHVGQHVDIPARDAVRVLDAVSLLRDMGTGEKPQLGRRVVVYGGGNTAMDAARTARRLGAEEALIVYRRDRAHMPAHGFEADEAMEEGVRIRWLTTIREIVGPSLKVERMTLDEHGRPQPTGEFETLEADSVVLALGQVSDSAFLRDVPGVAVKPDGVVDVDPAHDDRPSRHLRRRRPGAERSAPSRWRPATASWRRATSTPGCAVLRMTCRSGRRSSRSTCCICRCSPTWTCRSSGGWRMRNGCSGFEEVLAGLTEPAARHEAQRCLSCGVCYECDNCFAACPEQAIAKLGPGQGYSVDPALCTGCAVCFDQCPCHAIRMVAEATVKASAPSP